MTHLNETMALPFLDSMIDASLILSNNSTIPPAAMAGGIIIPDIYETYLNNLEPGETLEELTVDPGSQIIMMSDNVCHNLGLPYDPSV